MCTFRRSVFLVISCSLRAAASQAQSASEETIWFPVEADCEVEANGTCANSALELLQKGAKQNRKGLRTGGQHAGNLSTWRRRQLEYGPLSDDEWDDLIGEGGVFYKDMHQGGLGDCYLLAAVTTIAAVHPEIIRNMFVKGATGDNPVITTKWMVNGKQTLVAMDSKLPTNPHTMKPFFATPKGSSYWPSLLEKAWAKIFGDYKTVEGGMQREAFKAITQAPVTVYKHKDIKAGKGGFWAKHFWNTMAGAQKKKFIVGAGTGNEPCNEVGLYCGHAYAVIGTFAIEGHPQVVRMYNPHGANKYSGELKDLTDNWEDGEFWMTFNEYLDNFASTDVAETLDNGAVSDILLDVKNQGTLVLEFDMEQDAAFTVQFEWPMRRFFGEGCSIAEPTFTMAVAKKDDVENSELLVKQSMQMSTASAAIDGKKGTYQIAVFAQFPYSGSWLKDYVINVYGPKTELKVSEDTAAVDLFVATQGLCTTILVPGTAMYSGKEFGEYAISDSETVFGVPVFTRVEDADTETKAHPSYKIIWWDPKRQLNKGKSMSSRGGNNFKLSPTVAHARNSQAFSKFAGIPGAICKPASLQEKKEPGKKKPEPADLEVVKVEEKVSTEKWEQYDEEGEFLGETDQDENDSELFESNSQSDQDCGKYALRATELDNGAEIATTGEDSMFPAKMSSIARSGQDCGDTATGITESCDKFNKWVALEDIQEADKKKKSLSAKCKEDCNVDIECVTKYPISGKTQADFTMCTGETNWPMKYKCGKGTFKLKSAQIYNMPSWVADDEKCKAVTPISECKESKCAKDGCITKVATGGKCRVDFGMCGKGVKYKCSKGRAFNIPSAKAFKLPEWVCDDAECAPE